MGITTQNNETIVLECSNDAKVVNKTSCFKIYTPDNKIHIVCQKQVEERCVGLVTPSNLTVLFECHTCVSTKGGSDLPVYTDGYRKVFRSFIEFSLYTITQNNDALVNKTTLSVYTPEQDIKFTDCYNEIKNYEIHILHGHENCRGITMESFETVVLDCSNKVPERVGCYDVFSPVFSEDNKIIGPDRKVGNVCVRILNEWCVGLTTPKNWTIPLSCLEVPDLMCPLSSNTQ
ncbi:uncharacterized protein LOC108912981 [Anoplophora glabripennis]|uniref:uncharacterized protein LOC108912981 n=1 Tax=Anoplophora glabripennis TaxID=217634 RepID=UPI00087437F6|nr:uncharacterized protein LOC108912981 [Anoplophora glabripennis]